MRSSPPLRINLQFSFSGLANLPSEVLTHAVDDTDAYAMLRALETVTAELGPVDILFNNLGQSARDQLDPSPFTHVL